MSNLLAVDPGLRCSGVSLWGQGILKHVGLVRVKALRRPHHRGYRAQFNMAFAIKKWALELGFDRAVLVYEEMVYIQSWSQSKRGRNPVEDLFELVGITASLATMIDPGEVHHYSPLIWKPRGEKKADTHKRAWGMLSLEEKALASDMIKAMPQRLKHNALDALAIGLFHLGRG